MQGIKLVMEERQKVHQQLKQAWETEHNIKFVKPETLSPLSGGCRRLQGLSTS